MVDVELNIIQHALTIFQVFQGGLKFFLIQMCRIYCRFGHAHTPDGFEQFLKTLHNRKQNQIIHIFGFRGNSLSIKIGTMLKISEIME